MGELCKQCNMVDVKLVPFNDDGTGPKMCVRCKRKKKKGIPIKR